MATSRNYSLLSSVWRRWRDATGRKMKEIYSEFISLVSEGARAAGTTGSVAVLHALSSSNHPSLHEQRKGWEDLGDFQRQSYEDPDLENHIKNLWQKVYPLYRLLHAYTRKKLMEIYQKERFPSSGHIPASILGNMWSHSWVHLEHLLRPYKGKPSTDVTSTLKAQNYTVMQMFKTAENFFVSLGLYSMNASFWERSMLQKPTDGRQVMCHPTAWDFFNQKDFRVQMCTQIDMENLQIIHHEMGHIQYFMHYKHLPVVFRKGANPGFQEAVGDAIALSSMTPVYLHRIHLLDQVEDDFEADINFLMSMALEKIAFLPFGYLLDLWRWTVYSGTTPATQYNRVWWEHRCKYQGIFPPVKRTEKDFDAGAKFHVPFNIDYLRYFVGVIMQFQFHKALCRAANQKTPLHRCDIYNSTAAGSKLSSMMKLGSSRPWHDAMKAITGQQNMDAGPILEYFKPLTEWLESHVSKSDIGWSEECPNIPQENSATFFHHPFLSPISLALTFLAVLSL